MPVRSRALARSRRAAADRPTARRAGDRRDRRVRLGRARAARARGGVPARCPRRRAAARRCATPTGTASRLNCWNTKPMCWLRTSARRSSFKVATSSPDKAELTRRRDVEAADDVHQRRLARARRPDDRDELAVVDTQRTPRKASTRSSPVSYVFETSTRSMTAAVGSELTNPPRPCWRQGPGDRRAVGRRSGIVARRLRRAARSRPSLPLPGRR